MAEINIKVDVLCEECARCDYLTIAKIRELQDLEPGIQLLSEPKFYCANVANCSAAYRQYQMYQEMSGQSQQKQYP